MTTFEGVQWRFLEVTPKTYIYIHIYEVVVSNIVYVHPYLGLPIPNLTEKISNGLVQPPTSISIYIYIYNIYIYMYLSFNGIPSANLKPMFSEAWVWVPWPSAAP